MTAIKALEDMGRRGGADICLIFSQSTDIFSLTAHAGKSRSSQS